MNRALFFLMGLAFGVADAHGYEPPGAKENGRVVEGTIVAAGGRPIEGATVLFGPAGRGISFVQAATATTDARGRYRADLVKFAWSTATTRALILAPGYKVRDGEIEAGTQTATAHFELVAEPWKETHVRMEDQSGKPVTGAKITCSVGRVTWAHYTTDSLGCCRIAMAHDIGMKLKTEPHNARPIEAFFHGGKDDPASVTLTALPPIRGHRKFAGRPLAIVALHDQSVQSRASYDRRISTVRERIWSGRDLPFRVLLDRPTAGDPADFDGIGSGMTTKRYNVTGFPTVFLIDRDGTVVGRVNPLDHDQLESRIRSLVEKAEAVH